MPSIKTAMPENDIVHVAVGVIKDSHGHFLIAKRPEKSHQGGLWEFPGGKVEPGETVVDALKREIFEELGITFTQATPLIRIPHHYKDKAVLLDVWVVHEFTGKAFGKENQEIRWIKQDDLLKYTFPAANNAIIKAIQLPEKYLITGVFKDENDLLVRITRALEQGIRLIQFRAPLLEQELLLQYAENIYKRCQKFEAKLLLNIPADIYLNHQAKRISTGLHLTSKELLSFNREEFSADLLISASIHNQAELKQAEAGGIDFAVLSPVHNTQSHPDSVPLGWNKFQQLTELATIPVFALGGMSGHDISDAIRYGGQGIAAISEFWNEVVDT